MLAQHDALKVLAFKISILFHCSLPFPSLFFLLLLPPSLPPFTSHHSLLFLSLPFLFFFFPSLSPFHPLCSPFVPSGGCSSNGLSPDQLAASLATIQSLAVACQGDVKILRERPAEEGVTAECLVRRKVEEDDFLEVR